jgi:hypothetical protein
MILRERALWVLLIRESVIGINQSDDVTLVMKSEMPNHGHLICLGPPGMT